MGRKHVAKYVKRIDGHLKRHRKHVYRIFKKMARHPGCYKGGMMLMGAGMKGKSKGGMMLYGAGVKGKAKGGMMLYGAAMRVRRKKVGMKGHRLLRKKRKLPAWVTKPVPKSGWPSAPAGMTKKASGWYARQKAKAKALHAKAKAKAKKVWDHGKKIVTGVADHVADKVFESANGLVDQVGDSVDAHIDQLGSESQKYLDAKVDDYSGRASRAVSKAGKRGSGAFSNKSFNTRNALDIAARGRMTPRQRESSHMARDAIKNARPRTLYDYQR